MAGRVYDEMIMSMSRSLRSYERSGIIWLRIANCAASG